MGVLSAMAKQEAPYDAEVAQRHADNMLLLSQYMRAHLYAEGTSNADMPGNTRSLPIIWEDWDGYLEREAEFDAAAATMAEAAGDGLQSLQGAMGTLGGSCRACHQDYRAKDF